MQDAWQTYLELAFGLTEASKKKAQTVARKLVGQSGATVVQLQGLAEELIITGLANREALTKMIRFEVDRALGAVGLATADEVADLTARVRQLERERREVKPSAPSVGGPAVAVAPGTAVTSAGDTPADQGTSVAKKAVAKKAVAKKAVAKKGTSGELSPAARTAGGAA